MKSLSKIIAFAGILSAVAVGGMSVMTKATPSAEPPGPLFSPNVSLDVQRSAGTCPDEVGLWWFALSYEGGAEHTVVADTRLFADTSKLVSANNKVIEFASPLTSNYASCVGQTRSQQYPWYNVQFKNKQAYFRVDLTKLGVPYTEITYKTVVASRPYVRWAVAD